jgi:hypothetical protein
VERIEEKRIVVIEKVKAREVPPVLVGPVVITILFLVASAILVVLILITFVLIVTRALARGRLGAVAGRELRVAPTQAQEQPGARKRGAKTKGSPERNVGNSVHGLSGS